MLKPLYFDEDHLYMQTREEISVQLTKGFDGLADLLKSLPEDKLTEPIKNGWSALEQFDHLIRSNKPISLLLSLPKPVLFIYGTASKPSRSYHEIVSFYQDHLGKGAKASGPYVPAENGLASLTDGLKAWNGLKVKLSNGVLKWSESALDKYRAPHPILGKMTVRELLYFTIYHNNHHTKNIQSLL